MALNPAPLDSEALALAHTLVKLADLFEREANGWRDYPAVSTQCRRATGQLTEAARYVLRSSDLAWGEGWVAAGNQTLAHLQLVRLFRDGVDWQRMYVIHRPG